ncbi:MAG: GH74 / CBM13 / GH5_35 [uncultured Cytophagales bacterium]|uniref:GH74 / CBM13 / GH5_35 n=1 Tax=uncultured Cytophagales bacterium TaxID=158755 RepID=A0A6J4J5D4_9SPHI|nr:MAG: GH74 / CBM13 / GH5_35 [uncultured Cytophagales bacterium]
MKRNKLLRLLCLAALWCLGTPRGTAQVTVLTEWKNVRMLGGGFVSGVIYSPTQQDLLYARTDVGGAYRWDAAAQTWIPLTDHLSRFEQDYQGVLSLATDPSDPNRVYLATGLYTQSWAGTAAVLASTDKGNTWKTTKLGIKLGGNEDGRSTGERLQVDPNLGSTLYLGSSTDGLWKSTDYGATWGKVNSFPVAASPIGSGGISFVLFDGRSGTPGTPTPTIYVGVLQSGGPGLYRSTDGGATWAAVPGQPAGYMPHHAALSAAGALYLTYANGPGPNGVTAGDVMKYEPATNAWTSIRPDEGQQGGFAGLALDPRKPGTIMVSTIDRWWPGDEIFRSTDDGRTWKPLLAGATLDHSPAPYAAYSKPHWLGDLDLDPFNSDQAWFVTGYGVFGSKNITAADAGSGTTWTFLNGGLEETVPLGLVSPPVGAPLVSALGDIDGFKHDDVDASPAAGRLSPRYGTNTSIDFAELKPSYLVRTHNSGPGKYGAYSTDGGDTWTAFGTAPAGTNGGGSIAVSADAATLVWSPGGANGLFYSRDNGATWTASAGISAGVAPVADRVNGQKFYLYDAERGRVLVSTDGGASFTLGAGNLPSLASWELWKGSLRAVYGGEGDLWLTSPSGLFHSTDGGISFVKGLKVQDALKIGFGKAAAGKTYPALYLVGRVNNTEGFYRSDDGGTGWVRINDSKHQFGGINAVVGDPRTYGRVYLATSGRGIVYGNSQPYDGPTEQPGTAEVLFSENFGSWPGLEGGNAATYAGFSGKTQATYAGTNVFIQGWGGGSGYPGASGNATFLGRGVNQNTPLEISDIFIAGYGSLNLSFGLAWQLWWNDPNIPNYRPTVEVRVDEGQWLPLTQTASDYPALDGQFKLIEMPLVDADGKALTGRKLSIRLSAAANGANYRLDDLGLSGKKIIVNAQSIAVTTAGNVPARLSPGTTLQLRAGVLPENTTYPAVTWTVTEGTGKATVSSDGLLTATANGTVTVRATSQYTPAVSGELAVRITDIIPGRVFVVSARHSGKALSVRSGQAKDGLDVKQYPYTEAAHQQWKLEEAGNGSYRLLALHSGKSLSIDKADPKAGAKAAQLTYAGGAHQHWQIGETGDGYYTLTATHSGLALTVFKGHAEDTASIGQTAYAGAAFQQWKFDSVPGGGARQVTSAEEAAGEEAVRVYPNPVSRGAFQVSLADFAQDRGVLEVVSLTGKVVHAQRFGGESVLTVRQPLPPGIYLVRVLGGNAAVTRKLVVR